MAGSRSKHHLDATVFNRASIKALIIFLLELEQAMSSCHEVVDEIELVHAKLLGHSTAISGFPVGNIGRAHHIVFYFASDAHDTNLRPVL